MQPEAAAMVVWQGADALITLEGASEKFRVVKACE
jgi:hypothetical protein